MVLSIEVDTSLVWITSTLVWMPISLDNLLVSLLLLAESAVDMQVKLTHSTLSPWQSWCTAQGSPMSDKFFVFVYSIGLEISSEITVSNRKYCGNSKLDWELRKFKFLDERSPLKTFRKKSRLWLWLIKASERSSVSSDPKSLKVFLNLNFQNTFNELA